VSQVIGNFDTLEHFKPVLQLMFIFSVRIKSWEIALLIRHNNAVVINCCNALLAGFRHPGTCMYPKNPVGFFGCTNLKNPYFYFNLILVYTLYAIFYCFESF